MLGTVLSSTKVQTLLANQLSSRFSKNYSNTIRLQQFALSLDGRVALKGLLLADHHADTLAFVHQIKLSIADLNALLDGDLRLHALTLIDPYVKNTQYKDEDTDALENFIDQLRAKANGKSALISIDNLNFKSGTYKAYNQELNSPSLLLREVCLEAEQLVVKGKEIKVKINSLTAFEPKRSIALSQGQFDFNYTPKNVSIKDFYLKTNTEFIAGNFQLSDSVSVLKHWKNALWQLELDSLSTQPSRWITNKRFEAALPDIRGRLFGKGTLQQFELDTMVLRSQWGHLKLNGSVFELTDINKLRFDLNLKADQLLPKRWGAVFVPAFEKKIRSGDVLSINGQIKMNAKNLQHNLTLRGDWGISFWEGKWGKGFLMSEDKNTSFTLSTVLEDFEVSSLLASKTPVSLSGKVDVNGNGKTLEEISGRWKVGGLNLQFDKLPSMFIDGNGSYEAQQFKNSLSVSSTILSLKSDWVVDHTLEKPKIATAINVESLELSHFSSVLGEGKALFKGILLANISGTHWDHLTGSLTGASWSLETAVDTLNFSPLTLSQKWEDNQRVLTIENKDIVQLAIKGDYQTEAIVPLFQNALAEVYTFLPVVKIDASQSLRFNVTVFEKVLNALYPKLQADENLSVSGKIFSEKKQSQITLDMPFFRWDGFDLENIHFQLDTQNPIYNTYLSVDQLEFKEEKIKQFNLISTALMDTLYFRSEFNRKESTKPFEINFYHTLGPAKQVIFGMQPSQLMFGSIPWQLNPENLKTQQIIYDPSRKRWEGKEFFIQSDSAYLKASGFWESKEHLALHLKAQQLPLDELAPQKESFKSGGSIDIVLDYIRSPENNEFQWASIWKKAQINAQDLGDLNLSAKGNTLLNSYQFEFSLQDQQQKRLDGRGSLLGLEAPKLNCDLSFNAFKIDFLSALAKKALKDIRGELTGAVNLWGPLNRLKHNGTLNLQQGGIGIPYLNTDYSIAEANVNLYEQTFDFQKLTLQDTKENTAAQLKGKISHTNFKNWNAALNINSSKIMLLDKPNVPDVMFYGHGYLNGIISIDGPFRNLNITVTGSTETGTSIKIPWAEDYGLADTSFIQMIDKSKRNEIKKVNEKAEQEQISGLEMNFELDVNPKAEIEIVIDQETGSFLKGSGVGSLFMEINTAGKFNMWGDFITYDGIYNFKNLGVLDKKFNVKPGGTIVWEGDPLSAQMNIEARYEVPGGANPALMLDNPNFNKKIDTDVLIQLQGNLLKPDDPLFEIEFPNTSGTVASEINYRLADPQRRQLQALSLLSQGVFINEVSVSMQGITNNLYQKASDIFSSLLNEDNNKLQVGVDYLQGDKSALLDIATADRLGFTLSTKLSEKILLNGKIGVPVGGVEQTLVVGNVQIDFILNEDGTLKAKVFNKENEFRYISDELGYTQGVGLSYQVDFDTFSALIQKIVKGSKQEASPVSINVFNVEKQAAIEFVQKK